MKQIAVHVLVALSLAPVAAQADPIDPSPRVTEATALSFFDRPALAREWVEASVPTQQDRKLSRGYRFVSGCRAHACFVKSAAILSPDGLIVAAAIVALPCAETCLDVSHGRVFVHRVTPTWARTALIVWAKRVLAVNGRDEPATGESEVVALDDAKSPR